MIKVYTSPSCSSCRKVKKWLMDNDIPFIEKNILGPTFTEKDVYEILSRTENGTDDIIAKRSKIVQESGVDIESLTIKQYNPDDITIFTPVAKRIADYACTLAACPLYIDCEHKRED